MSSRLVVIGGGAAGMSAASAARRLDPTMQITVLEEGPYPSYGVCGIPYYLGGVVGDASRLIAYPVEEFIDRRRIDLRLNTAVRALDTSRRELRLDNGERLDYDTLIMATGAAPVRPDVPGIDLPGVVSIRRLEDAESLRARLPKLTSAVVVGAGYVGLETAEALAAQGLAVTVVDRLAQVLPSLDTELAAEVEAEVRLHVELVLNAEVRGIAQAGTQLVVDTGHGEIATDLVVLALGVRPRTGLLTRAGARVLRNGALVVDDSQATSLPGIYAAGDCATARHQVTGDPVYIPLGPIANKAGRVAGNVVAGGSARSPGVAGTAVVKVFGLGVAHTGLTLRDAQSAGLEAIATDLTSMSRAKYFPGATPLRMRLVHSPTGRVLGGQLVGSDGIKRVDVLAAALFAGLDVDDLAGLDLAYAPPFSPVYDPITQLAQAAQRHLRKVPA